MQTFSEHFGSKDTKSRQAWTPESERQETGDQFSFLWFHTGLHLHTVFVCLTASTRPTATWCQECVSCTSVSTASRHPALHAGNAQQIFVGWHVNRAWKRPRCRKTIPWFIELLSCLIPGRRIHDIIHVKTTWLIISTCGDLPGCPDWSSGFCS